MYLMRAIKPTLCLAIALSAFACSCKKDNNDPPAGGTSVPANPALEAAKREAVANYAEIVHASYSDAKTTAEALATAIDAFLNAPSAAGFEAAKQAWLAARIPYGQTEAYRFANGPIDDEEGPEGQLNAWPMDEAYVDYVVGNPTAGIINDPNNFPTINVELIASLNEVGGETNVSAGYHTIEFLLWGQDLSTTGPGARPWTDYTTATNATRRGTFLRACAELLVDDLSMLVDAWSPDGNNYRSSFVSGSTNAAIQGILQGIGTLAKGELAGERMEVAMLTQDQEDEHSCFSDNTHTDINMNIRGIQNVYLGRYVRTNGQTVSGTGIKDVLAVIASSEADALEVAIADSRTKCEAIPVPFDQQIMNGDPGDKVATAVAALKNTGDLISAAASRLGLTISTDVE